jgi:zinc protease
VMGGAAKMAAVKDFSEAAEMAMDASAGGMKIKQQSRWVKPNILRQDQILPFGTIVAFSDGKSGWLAMPPPQGVKSMPPQVLKQAHGEIFRQWLALMLSDQDSSRTVNAVGANSVEISTADGETVRVEFDDATGLPVRQSYKEGAADVKQTYSEWRDVDGIKLPFKAAIEQGGKKMADVSVTEIKLNTGLSADELSKKPEPKK